MILNIICDRCNGLFWEEFINDSHIDLSCLYCAKRVFVRKQKYIQFKRKVEKKFKNKPHVFVRYSENLSWNL